MLCNLTRFSKLAKGCAFSLSFKLETSTYVQLWGAKRSTEGDIVAGNADTIS